MMCFIPCSGWKDILTSQVPNRRRNIFLSLHIPALILSIWDHTVHFSILAYPCILVIFESTSSGNISLYHVYFMGIAVITSAAIFSQPSGWPYIFVPLEWSEICWTLWKWQCWINQWVCKRENELFVTAILQAISMGAELVMWIQEWVRSLCPVDR